jgi:hypothetical protein
MVTEESVDLGGHLKTGHRGAWKYVGAHEK